MPVTTSYPINVFDEMILPKLKTGYVNIDKLRRITIKKIIKDVSIKLQEDFGNLCRINGSGSKIFCNKKPTQKQIAFVKGFVEGIFYAL